MKPRNSHLSMTTKLLKIPKNRQTIEVVENNRQLNLQNNTLSMTTSTQMHQDYNTLNNFNSNFAQVMC